MRVSMAMLKEKYDSVAKEISDKETELKKLKEQEIQDDKAKPMKPIRRFEPAKNTTSDGQFPLSHLIIAIFGGLILGMIFAKMIFA